MAEVLAVRASRRLIALLILLHGAALAMIAVLLVLRVPLWGPLAGLALVAASLIQSWRLVRIKGEWRLKLPEFGDPVLVRGEDQQLLEMLPGCVDFAGIWIVLRWRALASGESQSICLMADSTDSTSWRRLRIWLRWRAFSPDRSRSASP
ncbi:protein YgfX [Niveibacterium terrae]|uniref:protein YgfX n=1 Tax=Niveibacterium terrae TaxID=3373598 RepID=UPI003A934276